MPKLKDTSWVPNLLIPGAPKAGTFSLQKWLVDHPGALGSSEKETYYFVDAEFAASNRELAEYFDLDLTNWPT